MIFSRKRKLHFFFLFAQSPFMHGASGAYMRTCLVRLTIKAGLPFFSKILIYLRKEKDFIFSQLFQIRWPKTFTYRIIGKHKSMELSNSFVKTYNAHVLGTLNYQIRISFLFKNTYLLTKGKSFYFFQIVSNTVA